MKTKKTNNSEEISTFIKILVIVGIFLIVVYGLTVLLVSNKDETPITQEANAEEVEETIDYDQTLIGSMFDLEYDDYYVLIYKDSARNASLLDELMTTYRDKDDSKKLFYINLDDVLNRDYYNKDESNTKPKNVSEVQVKDYTLIRFKNNKVTEYHETFNDIYKKLS